MAYCHKSISYLAHKIRKGQKVKHMVRTRSLIKFRLQSLIIRSTIWSLMCFLNSGEASPCMLCHTNPTPGAWSSMGEHGRCCHIEHYNLSITNKFYQYSKNIEIPPIPKVWGKWNHTGCVRALIRSMIRSNFRPDLCLRWSEEGFKSWANLALCVSHDSFSWQHLLGLAQSIEPKEDRSICHVMQFNVNKWIEIINF